MSYIAPFWRLLTVSASSLGSSGYLQNRFCQAHWSIMHWHQRAYFHFNNTEIFLPLRDFFFSFFTDLCDRMKAVWRWSNSRLFQVTSPLSPLSELLQRGWGNEREPWLEGLSPKQHQITCFFLFLPVHQRDMSQSNTVCHGIPRQLVDPTMKRRLMSCHLLSLPCLVVLCQITRNVPEKSRVALFTQCETCRGIYSMLLVLLCDPEKSNRKNSLWNHTCLWCSHVDAFRARTSGGESTSYVRWQMIYILQAEQQGLNQKMHMCNKFAITARLNFPCRRGKSWDVHVAGW